MKKSLFTVHKVLALLFSLPFFIIAITGLVMTLEFKDEAPKTPVENPVSLHSILSSFHETRPDSQITRVNFNDQTVTLYVKTDSLKFVTIERAEGKIIKEENPMMNPFYFSKQVHESLLLKGTGKVIIAICGLGLTLVLLSGFFYWMKKSFFSQVKNLFATGKISRPKDLHLMAAVLVMLPLLFAGGTGFLIELNKLFCSDKKFDEHTRPASCSLAEQIAVIGTLNPGPGRINFCRPDHPYMTVIGKTETREVTPQGLVVQTVKKENWNENFFYRKHHFVHLHGGDDFGAFKTPYRLWIGLGFLLLNITGILIWVKKRKGSLPGQNAFDISNSSTPSKA